MARRYDVQFTPAARDDLKTLALYLAVEASLEIAEAFLDKIEQRIEALSQFPHRGSIPRELESIGMSDYLQIVIGKFRVLYRVYDNYVSVVLVADGRRDMPALLRQRLFTPPDSPR